MKNIEIPDKQLIECQIQTPQFKNNKIWYMKKQSGVFDKETMLFTHTFNIKDDLLDFRVGGHNVQFQSIEEFKSSVIKIYQ
jgi:hypothetical protein